MQGSGGIGRGFTDGCRYWLSDVVSRCLEVAGRAGPLGREVDDRSISTPLMFERVCGEA
ncbi:hypothetical protein D3C81_1768200 [compost metagenome]